MVSKIRGVTPRINILPSNPSMDRKVFEPYRMMFEELKGINKAEKINMLLESNEKTLKNFNTFFLGGGENYWWIFAFRRVS